ncbi:MAG TPA: HEAT repeat domain-containing protein [Pirellulaceae bacterium]|jgi:hypothetical protein|nr:HEAT repeat domain-containing protein [Pirellulaceae bacterium]
MNDLLRPLFSLRAFALFAAALSCFAADLRAYDPKSPEVVEMVKKAIAFLESDAAKPSYNHYGASGVVAYALLKTGAQPDHPKIQAAVDEIRERVKGPPESWEGEEGSVYALCVALILLCEVDGQLHSTEIQKLVDQLLKRQHQSGCWGYRQAPSVGDTSQQQYAILALWTADYNGFQVPTDAVERGLNWLMRVQDPQGRYCYKPQDPGSYQPVNQDATSFRPSLQAAGTGSLYVAGDLLKLVSKVEAEDEDILPPPLRMIKADMNRPGAPRVVKNVPEDMFRQRVGMADNAFAAMYSMNSPWQYYYLYTLERYASFRSNATGWRQTGWYDDGVKFLQEKQAKDGSWRGGESTTGPGVDTAFGILFLVRSTAKSIQKKIQREGLLLGGMGLPTDTTNVRIRGGRVVGMELSKNLDDLIGLLESENAQDDVELLAQQIEQLEIVPGAKLDDAQTARLNRLAGHPAYDVRILAAKAMMRSRDVRVATALIYALSDPDERVRSAAVDGLRFISRRFDGQGLPPDPSKLEIEKAQNYWRAWYRTVAPPGSPVQ